MVYTSHKLVQLEHYFSAYMFIKIIEMMKSIHNKMPQGSTRRNITRWINNNNIIVKKDLVIIRKVFVALCLTQHIILIYNITITYS
jgi:hypothetical protein